MKSLIAALACYLVIVAPAEAYGERLVCYRDYNGHVVCEVRQ